MTAVVHATQPTYELHSLGWKAFQQLCLTVVNELWGQTVQGFFDSRDGGRDGAFHGTWTPKDGPALSGAFTVQCKSSLKPDKILRVSDVGDELTKARRLAARGLADHYFLFTSGHLTGEADAEIRSVFEAIPGIKSCTVYGVERISEFIRESPRLRMLVPRIYGLGDLSQILDERAYAQAREILSSLGDDLEKFVITDAYNRAARAVAEHGFVLLLGEPACGKSTIAAALAVGALDVWKCSTVKARDADDVVAHSNPQELKQFFWIDDAFGATQIDWQGTIRWNNAFPHIQAAIRRGARFVLTSRTYIYNSARSILKETALPVLRESQVVIQVENITKEERRQILYNHIRLGSQPRSFKREVKPYLKSVASHKNFGPEIARRLGNPAFTRQLDISAYGLEDFVARPRALLRDVIQTLDANSRSAIALVFMSGGNLPSPINLTHEEEHAITLLGGSVVEIRNALVALNGSLLIQVQQDGRFYWRFKHPTIRDAFASIVAENRELLDIYVAGTPVLRLFEEVSCGDVGMEGVKVIIPTDRYEAMLARVEGFQAARRENRDVVNRFLAFRCDCEFLKAFISRNPDFVSSLMVYSYLYAVPDVNVIVRLREFGLLPEADRKRHVSTLKRLAVETPDSGVLRPNVRRLFSDDEFADMMESIRSKLMDGLERTIDVWHYNHGSEDDPEEYFSELKSALNDYREKFEGDESVVTRIDTGFARIDEIIEEIRSGQPEEPDGDEYHGGTTTYEELPDERSIFDDVDE